MKTIYRVTNDHGYSSVYFESEEDAEKYLDQLQLGAASGMQIDVIHVISAATPKEKPHDNVPNL